MPLEGLGNGIQEFVVLLCTPGSVPDECLLGVGVKILVSNHVVEPSLFQDGRKDFTHTRCQNNRSEIPGFSWVICS